MEIRRHFGAKAKEKEAKDDFGPEISEECRSTHSWCRSTPVLAQQKPYTLSSLPYLPQFAPEDFPICIISLWTFLGSIYIVFTPKFLLSSLFIKLLQNPIVRDISYSSIVLERFIPVFNTVKRSLLSPFLFTVIMLSHLIMLFASSNMSE